ncbi:hypothetical protein BBD41_11130 [Paenibacillus ihbetae]|uniref:Uncharacterized protein n=1 Tax=Paenibacillus ihbetae TaxID=1870820 RepID=A0A1B2DZD4_9BACL|nr:hypothetical protein BBD41_11130 [Paenibacillus ihbetae]
MRLMKFPDFKGERQVSSAPELPLSREALVQPNTMENTGKELPAGVLLREEAGSWGRGVQSLRSPHIILQTLLTLFIYTLYTVYKDIHSEHSKHYIITVSVQPNQFITRNINKVNVGKG